MLFPLHAAGDNESCSLPEPCLTFQAVSYQLPPSVLMNQPLPRFELMGRVFFERDPRNVAVELLGAWLWTCLDGELTAGIIVETEAYLAQDDPACHASRGLTRGNQTMFGPPGHAYVYVIHARHCFNVVTQATGVASAVLVRAIEPRIGLERMQLRRGKNGKRDITTGPARLCEALGIDRSLDGVDLLGHAKIGIGFEASSNASASPAIVHEVLTTPRIGVTSAHDSLLRYVCRGNEYVSGPRKGRE